MGTASSKTLLFRRGFSCRCYSEWTLTSGAPQLGLTFTTVMYSIQVRSSAIKGSPWHGIHTSVPQAPVLCLHAQVFPMTTQEYINILLIGDPAIPTSGFGLSKNVIVVCVLLSSFHALYCYLISWL